MVKNVLSLLLGLCAVTHSFGQGHPKIDSLLQVLDTVQAQQKPYVQQELAFTYELYANLLQTRQYTKEVLQGLNQDAYPTVAIEMYALLAYTFLVNLAHDSAMHYHKLENQVARKAGQAEAIGLSMSRIGVIFFETNRFDSAKWYIEQGIEILEKTNNTTYLYKVYTHYANAHLFHKDYAVAQQYYLKALQQAEALQQTRYIANAYAKLSTVANQLKSFDLLLQYTKQSYTLYQKLQVMPMWAIANQNLAEAYNKLGLSDSAVHYQNQAVELAETYGYEAYLPHMYNVLGTYLWRANQFHLVIETYQKGIQMAQKVQDTVKLVELNNLLSRAYGFTQQYQASIATVKKNLKLLKPNQFEDRCNAYTILGECYKLTKNYQAATTALDSALELSHKDKLHKDSVMNTQVASQIHELTIQYETEKKEQAIVALNEKQELSQQVIVRQRLLQLGLGVLAVLLLAIGALIYRSRRRALTDKDAIAHQKEEIEAQAEELQTTNDKMVALDGFKQKMMGHIVHDLKNPLNLIYNNTSSPQIKQTTASMMNLVLNLLDTQKLESTQLAVQAEDKNLYELVNQAVQQVQYMAEQKQVELVLQVPQAMQLLADAGLTVRVFVNLLTNAIKYAPLNSQVTITAQPAPLPGGGQGITIGVADQGPGIPAQQQQHLFSAYNTGGRGQGIAPSTGLGLHFCQLAVEAHRGTIQVSSAPGQGTTMLVTLPATAAVATPAVATSHQASVAFTAAELSTLAPYIKQLQQIAFYEYNKVADVMDSITTDANTNITRWKESILQSVLMSNQVAYQQLIEFNNYVGKS